MKNFFYNLGTKFQKFMYGRYGIDRLYNILLFAYLIILITALVIGRAVDSRLYSVISLAGLLLILFAFYRVFSKNIEKRRKENAKWMRFENKVKKHFRLLSQKWKCRKTHIFRKCPKCKSDLRLKKIKIKHRVSCPHCNENFEIRVLF